MKPKKLFPPMEFPIDPSAVDRYRHTLKLMETAQRMKAKGVRVDLERCKKHIENSKERAEFFTELFLRLTGLPRAALGDAGAGATKAVRSWFWDEMKAPPILFDKLTKKPQFNTPTLIGYATDFRGKPFAAPAAALFGLRKAKTSAKFARAYYEVASRHEGRIHFGFNVCGTKGERWSAAAKWRWWDEGTGDWVKFKLNAQNVPSKEPKYKFEGDEKPTKLALSLRDIFIPDDGMTWIKFDGDQAEARLIAYTANASKLIEWIDTGKDLHIQNAYILFPEAKIPPGWEDKDDPAFKQFKPFRDGSKPVMYGGAYSMPNDKGETHVGELTKQLKGAGFPDADEQYVGLVVERLFGTHHEIRAWQNWTKRTIKETGRFTLPQNGRFLWLPATMRGYNMAANFQMQSGYGYLINRAAPVIEQRIERTGADLLIQLHDEVDIQAPIGMEKEICAIASEELSRPARFGQIEAGIPHAGDIGPNWNETKAA